MTATVTWTVANLEYTNDDNRGVVVAHYQVEVTDGTDTVGAYGTQSFTPDPTAESFTPYSDLTEEQVIGWVKEALGEESVANIASQLEYKLAEKKNPPVVAGMPWAE
jgi:hypothetical protein